MADNEPTLLSVLAVLTRGILERIERTEGSTALVGGRTVADCIKRLDRAMEAQAASQDGLHASHLAKPLASSSASSQRGSGPDRSPGRDRGPDQPSDRNPGPDRSPGHGKKEGPGGTAEPAPASGSVSSASVHLIRATASATVSAPREVVDRLLQAVDRCLYWDIAKGTGAPDTVGAFRELEAASVSFAREVGWERGAWKDGPR